MTIKIELEFIPVSERLPESGYKYLVQWQTTDWGISEYNYSKKEFNNPWPSIPITHWAKLPDLSKKKEEDRKKQMEEALAMEALKKHFLDQNIKWAEVVPKPFFSDNQQRRRDLFERVAIACLMNDFGKTIEYENEWLNVVERKTQKTLERADRFARGV